MSNDINGVLSGLRRTAGVKDPEIPVNTAKPQNTVNSDNTVNTQNDVITQKPQNTVNSDKSQKPVKPQITQNDVITQKSQITQNSYFSTGKPFSKPKKLSRYSDEDFTVRKTMVFAPSTLKKIGELRYITDLTINEIMDEAINQLYLNYKK